MEVKVEENMHNFVFYHTLLYDSLCVRALACVSARISISLENSHKVLRRFLSTSFWETVEKLNKATENNLLFRPYKKLFGRGC